MPTPSEAFPSTFGRSSCRRPRQRTARQTDTRFPASRPSTQNRRPCSSCSVNRKSSHLKTHRRQSCSKSHRRQPRSRGRLPCPQLEKSGIRRRFIARTIAECARRGLLKVKRGGRKGTTMSECNRYTLTYMWIRHRDEDGMWRWEQPTDDWKRYVDERKNRGTFFPAIAARAESPGVGIPYRSPTLPPSPFHHFSLKGPLARAG